MSPIHCVCWSRQVSDIVDGDAERYTPASDMHRSVEVRTFERINVPNVTFRY